MPEIIQGRFTSTGARMVIPIPVEVDQFDVWNYTQSVAGVTSGAFRNHWALGMPALGGITEFKSGAHTIDILTNDATNPGFLLYDDSNPSFSQPQALTGITNAATFTVTGSSGLGGLQTGDTVILQTLNNGDYNIQGYPFQVTKVNATTFTNTYALGAEPGQTASSGFYRIVYSTPQPWYPTQRYINNIDVGTNTVTTSVDHGFQVGQTVLFSIPSTFGTAELNGLSATIIDVPTNGTFVTDLDMSAFTAFTWAPAVTGAFNFATVAPAYMNTAIANQFDVNPYSDARMTLATKGMILFPGTNGPAGVTGNIIYWSAISATSVMNM